MFTYPSSLKSADHLLIYHHRPTDLDFLLLSTVFLFGSLNNYCPLLMCKPLQMLEIKSVRFYYFYFKIY